MLTLVKTARDFIAFLVGIDEPAAAYRIWPKVPCRGQGRQNYIGVAAVEWLVYTMRADITDQRRQVRREFALDIEIPLHHVVAWGVALSGSVFERLWTEEPERTPRERARF